MNSSSDSGQTCRWHPDEAGDSSYRILSVSVTPWSGSAEAQEQVNVSAEQEQIAPKPVTLGDKAIAGAAQAPGKSVMIHGRHQTLALTGADLAVRVNNVSIDIMWLGADYVLDSHGSPMKVTGIPRAQAIHEATDLAQAIIPHIR